MSESEVPPSEIGDQEWPSHCEHCGTRLESAMVQVAPAPDGEHRQTGTPGPVVAQDFCPNPDCPGRAGDTPATS